MDKVEKFQGGSVKAHISQWECLTSDPEILEMVSGMPISVTSQLSPLNICQYPLRKKETDFIKEELQNLLKKNVIKKSLPEPGQFISPIFVREKPDGGFRLILNLKKLNETIEYKKFKMETISSILQLIRPGMFMAKLDIKDAYYSIPIIESDQKLLKFQFDDILYHYTALPNGYTEGPRKFTKLLKPPLSVLRKVEKILIAGYFDDLITMAYTDKHCLSNIGKTIKLFTSLGFVIHPNKSVFVPCQQIEYLGFDLNSVRMTISLTEAKKFSLYELCNDIIGKSRVTIREIAKILGKFSSSFVAVPFGRLHFRALERCKTKALKENKGDFDKLTTIPDSAKEDIIWWKNNILQSFAEITRENPSITINTDASSFGWGAATGSEKTGGYFNMEERESHINTLELKAVLFGLQTLCNSVTSSHILVQVDNTSAVSAINKMGSIRSLEMDREVHKIWEWAQFNDNWVTATHIPGILNTEADKESRQQETRTEWMLNKTSFKNIQKELSFFPNIDLFASRLNKQVPCFISYRPDPECVAVDAFTQSWTGLDFYAFPPFICIPKVLQKIWNDQAFGILIVPDWPNQLWYSQFEELIVKEIILPPRPDLLVLPTTQSTHPLHKNLSLRAALVSGKLSHLHMNRKTYKNY